VGDERYADIVLRCLDSSVTDKDNCLCAVRALFEGHVDINPLLVLFEARSPLQAGQVLEINPLRRGHSDRPLFLFLLSRSTKLLLLSVSSFKLSVSKHRVIHRLRAQIYLCVYRMHWSALRLPA
jgi:hypothetical protein